MDIDSTPRPQALVCYRKPPAEDGTRRTAFLIPRRFASDSEGAVGGNFECGADGAGHLVGVGPESVCGELDGGAAVV